MKKMVTIFTFIMITSIYSQNKKLDRIINLRFNQTTNIWEETSKAEFSYNTNSQVTDDVFYTKDDSDNWNVNWEVFYSYDANNNLIELLENQENWLNHKEVNTYNADNLLTQKIITEKLVSSSDWNNIERQTNTYNDLLLTEKNIETYNNSLNQWDIYMKTTYQYNGNLITISIDYQYDETQTQWNEYRKKTYQYNGNGKLIELISFNKDASSWLESDKKQYSYDANLDLIEKKYSLYNQTTQLWEEEEKEVSIQYDNEFDYSHLILPERIFTDVSSIYCNHKLDNLDVYYQGQFDYKSELYYSDFSLATNDFTNQSLKIYPNPFENEINIFSKTDKLFSLVLYDLQGNIVINKKIIENKINVSQLNNGMYFYRILDGKNIKSGKIIKNKNGL